MSHMLSEVLNRDDVKSRIIKDAAFFDAFMGVAIGLYFSRNDRFYTFHELVVERMSFNEKITVLEKIPYEKKYKSQGCFKTIRTIQRLRNIIAHEYYFHDDKKLRKGPWKELLSNWPETYTKEFKRAKLQIERLTRTGEFLKGGR
ncbi:hypothetical protein [Marinobacter oulmenensis]|uniref:DUF4145 domain-containing protein n=1 Tax=Marinobacter oulmenensis TaxID=643747 RepID=A0A840UHN4_9GAMM|nr:hypothetical protein [Marinobacter oulmenensis]MBB5320307.1 hypothetical protein [Marinobacter oulmenensis]